MGVIRREGCLYCGFKKGQELLSCEPPTAKHSRESNFAL
jgi:hypothetical protein